MGEGYGRILCIAVLFNQWCVVFRSAALGMAGAARVLSPRERYGCDDCFMWVGEGGGGRGGSLLMMLMLVGLGGDGGGGGES